MSSKCLADIFFIADTSLENFLIVSRPKVGMRRNLPIRLAQASKRPQKSLPLVELVNFFRPHRIQDSDEMGKYHLEHADLKVMQDVNNEQFKWFYPQ